MTEPAARREERKLPWHWRDVQVENPTPIPTEEPKNPEVGTHWFDLETNCLCVWDGTDWEPVSHD